MRKLLNILFIVLALLVMLIPFVYWILNPELTSMQVFLKTGWVYIPCFLITHFANKHLESSKTKQPTCKHCKSETRISKEGLCYGCTTIKENQS